MESDEPPVVTNEANDVVAIDDSTWAASGSSLPTIEQATSEPPAFAPLLDPRVPPNGEFHLLLPSQLEQLVQQRTAEHQITAPRASNDGLLPLTVDEYLTLLDFVGREVRRDKRGAIPAHLPPILERIRMPASQFDELVDRVCQAARGTSETHDALRLPLVRRANDARELPKNKADRAPTAPGRQKSRSAVSPLSRPP